MTISLVGVRGFVLVENLPPLIQVLVYYLWAFYSIGYSPSSACLMLAASIMLACGGEVLVGSAIRSLV